MKAFNAIFGRFYEKKKDLSVIMLHLCCGPMKVGENSQRSACLSHLHRLVNYSRKIFFLVTATI